MFALTTLLVVIVIGFVAQFVDGTVGMGYGAFSASVFIAWGIYPAIASASIHTAEVFTTLLSGGSHLFFRNVKRDWLLPLVLPGMAGGIAGAYFLVSIPGDSMRPFVAAILLILGIIVLYRFGRRGVKLNKSSITDGIDPPTATYPTTVSTPSKKLAILGLIAAFVDAVGGGGWGPITTPGLILTEDVEPRKVVGTVNLAEFFITVAISVTFILTLGLKLFRWDLVVALLVGGAIAAPLAAYLCRRMPARMLGIIVGLALIAFNLKTIIEIL